MFTLTTSTKNMVCGFYLQSALQTVIFKGYRFSLEVVKFYFKQMQILEMYFFLKF